MERAYNRDRTLRTGTQARTGRLRQCRSTTMTVSILHVYAVVYLPRCRRGRLEARNSSRGIKTKGEGGRRGNVRSSRTNTTNQSSYSMN